MSLFHLNNQSITQSIQQSSTHGLGGKESRGKKSKQATTHSPNQPIQPNNQPTNQTCSHSNDKYIFQHIQNKLWKETVNGL
jgi:hypothetical protein